MVFWNVEKLAVRFKNNEVTEKEKFQYLLIFLVSTSLLSYFPVEYTSNGEKYIEMFVALTISILGTLACYIQNQKGDGRFFIERFISLGFPIGIKIIVLGILLYILFLFISLFVTAGRLVDHLFIDILFITIAEIVFYMLVYRWIRFVSHEPRV
jgi:hypothetical protein